MKTFHVLMLNFSINFPELSLIAPQMVAFFGPEFELMENLDSRMDLMFDQIHSRLNQYTRVFWFKKTDYESKDWKLLVIL